MLSLLMSEQMGVGGSPHRHFLRLQLYPGSGLLHVDCGSRVSKPYWHGRSTLTKGSSQIYPSQGQDCRIVPYRISDRVSRLQLADRQPHLNTYPSKSNIICGIIVPRMLSPTAWNWGPKSGIFWFGMNSLCIIWCVFRLPETRNRSVSRRGEPPSMA